MVKWVQILLRKHATAAIQKEAELNAQKRRGILEERIGLDMHSSVKDSRDLIEVCKKYHERIRALEESRYDLEVKVRDKDYVVRRRLLESIFQSWDPGFCCCLAQRNEHSSQGTTWKVRQANT